MKDLHTIKSKTVAPLLRGAFAQSRYGEEVLAAHGLPPDIMSGGDFVLRKFAICAAADQLARREALVHESETCPLFLNSFAKQGQFVRGLSGSRVG